VPSVFSHAAAALGLATVARRPGPPPRLWIAVAACAMAPDLDAIGVPFGVPWGSMLGHRGFTHSLPFAVVLGVVVAATAFRGPRWRRQGGQIALILVIATASHGFLDAMTSGGSGVAFFAPFDATRYFLPWRPIPVSPFALRFFSARGARVFEAELLLIWLPSAALALGATAARWRRP
jgi:inner membrane protein